VVSVNCRLQKLDVTGLSGMLSFFIICDVVLLLVTFVLLGGIVEAND
jgi:hypothetical protein